MGMEVAKDVQNLATELDLNRHNDNLPMTGKLIHIHPTIIAIERTPDLQISWIFILQRI
jgi:hypothetical protein